jgi:hypothetical protein
MPNKFTFVDNSHKKTELLNAMQPQFFIYNKAATDNQRNFNFSNGCHFEWRVPLILTYKKAAMDN